MKSRVSKIIGSIIGLIGAIIAIILLIPGLSPMMRWTHGSTDRLLISGYMILALLIAWLIAIIGSVLGILTKKFGGLFLLLAGSICLGIFLYSISFQIDSPDPSAFSFMDPPYGGILYLVGGIITIINEKKK